MSDDDDAPNNAPNDANEDFLMNSFLLACIESITLILLHSFPLSISPMLQAGGYEAPIMPQSCTRLGIRLH